MMESLEGTMTGIPSPDIISTKVQRIATLANQAPEMAFTSLAHHIDINWLREAYRRTRKDGAVGIDGQTATAYAGNLESNLQDLLNRAKSGTYRAPPVRRVHIPKGDGGQTRPIGIPTFEDKILQRAVAMALEAVYEQDFLDSSYGFRPGRSAHKALGYFRNRLMEMTGAWVVEVDISKFFDTLDHGHLRTILQQRVRDGVLLRLIGKWLNAGVLESGNITRPEAGSPQGGVISPLLANVYLHEVFDTWFERDVKPRLRGVAFPIRYADDIAIVFSCEEDARRVMDVLPKRFGKYGLTLHPEKTTLIDFRRPNSGRPDGWQPETFDLLGFTHHWAKSWRGNWVVKQKTASSRFNRGLKAISTWCRRNLHQPIEVQHRLLSSKLRGHNAYYGVTGNSYALSRFRCEVIRIWRKWLGRRSQKAARTWEWFSRVHARFPLPWPIAVHSTLLRRANPSC
jgi:RNA-directed DNA polymerase